MVFYNINSKHKIPSNALTTFTLSLSLLFTACGSGTEPVLPKTTSSSESTAVLSSALITSLAATYPGGKLLAERSAEAAAMLAQNPAVLRYDASTAKANLKASSQVSPQATTDIYAPFVAVQRAQNTNLIGSYFFSIFPSEMTNALAANPSWNLEGAAFFTSTAPNVKMPAATLSLSPVWRFRNIRNGSYLYTIDEGEKNDIIANYKAYFVLEGPAWYAFPSALGYTGFSYTKPLYRFRNLTNGTYLFTAFENEKDDIVASYSSVFKLEGVAYYVSSTLPTTVPYKSVGSYDKTECVFDSSTGLTWEGKPSSGFRANTNAFTNFDDVTKLQNSTTGTPSLPTLAEVNAATNTVGYVAAVNAMALCGYTNWRMPTYSEFLTINKVANGGLGTDGSGVGIDYNVAAWFPNTNITAPIWSRTWTSTPDASQSIGAQYINYGSNTGHFLMPRKDTFKIRLVR